MEFSESDVVESREYEDGDGSPYDLSIAYQAAATGDTDTLVSAIKSDPSVLETPDSEGLTPLGHAVMAQQLECMKILVKLGASINTHDSTGRSYLSIVAYQGWYDGLIFLLRNGACQQTVDKAGRSPLHAATYDTNVRIIKALLQTLSIDDINLKDNEGMTALHWASFHNRPEYVQLLLRKDANPMTLDIDGKTPLHWSAQTGSLNCCRLLANHPRATDSVNLMDASGKTPVHFAAAAGHKAVINLLAKIPHVDLEAEDPDERTPLHWAAASGNLTTVSTLLDLRVNPCPLDVDGGTPLDYAKQSGHKDCVKALEDRLGIHPLPEGRRTTRSAHDKDKRSNLGLLSGLFKRKKKKKKKERNSDITSENLETVCESSGESSQAGAAVPGCDQGVDESKKPTRRKSKSKTKNKTIVLPPGGEGAQSENNDRENGDSDPDVVKTFKYSSESIPSIYLSEIKKTYSNNGTLPDITPHPPLPPLVNRSVHSVSSKDLDKMADEWIKSRSPENRDKHGTLEKMTITAGTRNKSISVGDISKGDGSKIPLCPPSPPNTSRSNPERKSAKTDLAPLKVPRSKLSSTNPPIGVNLKVAELRLDRGGINRTPTPPGWDQSPINHERRLKPIQQSGIAHDVERFRELTQHSLTRQEDLQKHKEQEMIVMKSRKSSIRSPEVPASPNQPRLSPVPVDLGSCKNLTGSCNSLAEFHEERRALDKGLNNLLR